MKKFMTLSVAWLMAAGCIVAGTTDKASYAQKLKKTGIQNFVSVPGMVNRSNASLQSEKAGFAKLKNAPSRVDEADADTATYKFSSESYGWVTGSDDNNWYFTQESTYRDSVYSEYYTAHFYETSKITVYNNNHEQVGQFTLQVPEGWIHVTGVEPYGPVTNKLFDFDATSNEILVEFHDSYMGTNKYLTRAYDISTGEVKFEKEGTGVVFQSAANAWTVYNRLIMTTETDSTYNVDIIAPPTWGQTEAYVEKSFSFDLDNRINYLQSPCFNCLDVDGTPYYVITKYEKPFTTTDAGDGTQDIVQTPDNYVTLCTYDKKFNKVDSLAVSIDAPDGVTYRSAAFGLFGHKDLSKGYYSDSDKLNYVVELLDYMPGLDADLASFAVYDSKNGKLKDICDKVTSSQWGLLNTIHGKSDQMWFLQTLGTDNTASQQIMLVDVPSCTESTYLSQEIEGNSISSTFDRYPCATNGYGYQYVISLSKAETNESGDVLAPIAWVNPNRTIDHIDRLSLGTDAEYFTPLLNSTSLNPYLFNTDDDIEYVYIAKKKRTDGSNKVDNVLEVAKTDGTVLKSWRGTDSLVFTTASLPLMNENGKIEMMVCFKNYETGNYDIDFYDLPFTKFEGGEGTKENPYLIATVGDLQQIAQNPDKAYKIVNDLDMSKSASYWSPINSFTGVLDGDGHTIYNLDIQTDDSHAGLFGTLDNLGIAKNIVFVKPTIQLTSGNQYAGILAGESSYDYTGVGTDVNIDNIYVYDATISGEAEVCVGGIVGCQSLYSTIANSSFQGGIEAPNASMVGGIVGRQRTSSTVTASYANVSAVASSSLGGIVGEAGSVQDGCSVTNCEVDGMLFADNNVGGIMGYSYANRINNCISHVEVVALNPTSWGGYAAGGIVGGLEPDWSASGTYTVISNCIFDGNVRATDAKGDDIANPATLHQIVGKTIADETYEEGETPMVETRIKNNYTTADFGNTDATSVEGAYKDSKELNKEFLESINFAYGTTKAEPWKAQGSSLPTLYFNNIAKALFVSNDDVTVGTTDEGNAEVTVSVYGVDDIDLESDLDVKVSNSNATVEMGEADGNSITLIIKGNKTGLSSINVSYGELSSSIVVTVLANYVNGIEEASAADAFSVKAEGGEIKAEGASSILVYSVNGQLVGKTNGESYATSSLTKGIYVAKATDSEGHTATVKFAVK